MTTFPRDTTGTIPPGTWRLLSNGDKRGATIRCPVAGCGVASTLAAGAGHVVADDGAVSPSVVCPGRDEAGRRCSFHDYVKLDGWEETQR